MASPSDGQRRDVTVASPSDGQLADAVEGLVTSPSDGQLADAVEDLVVAAADQPVVGDVEAVDGQRAGRQQRQHVQVPLGGVQRQPRGLRGVGRLCGYEDGQ